MGKWKVFRLVVVHKDNKFDTNLLSLTGYCLWLWFLETRGSKFIENSTILKHHWVSWKLFISACYTSLCTNNRKAIYPCIQQLYVIFRIFSGLTKSRTFMGCWYLFSNDTLNHVFGSKTSGLFRLRVYSENSSVWK